MIDKEKRRTGKEDRPLILAVTGGIATGKSTVSRMLEELGAPLIDLDVLARRVVEPGKPAWREIVDFFGREILLQDGRIDRKRLSGVVFGDAEKRKRLEGFTHPRIFEEMRRKIDEIAAGDPGAIVQIGIPLLFELDLQQKFDKVLLVYAPPELQIRRLMERDRIDRETAGEILEAQMPIDEKVGRADFVIRNEGSLAETRGQVVEVWGRLQEEQRRRKSMEYGV
jgi:dephospho-CoA kinase